MNFQRSARPALLLAAIASLVPPTPAQVVGGATDVTGTLAGTYALAHFGASVAGIGDIDGDGLSDLVVGNPGANPSGLSNAGSAFVYSGATLTELIRFDGANANESFGTSVAGAGDVDGDGTPDLIIGSPSATPAGKPATGSAFVFSGATGALLWRFDGENGSDRFGEAVAGAGDVDGDGFDDLIVGAPDFVATGFSTSGAAYVRSGATGAQLYKFTGPPSGGNLGSSVDGAGDVDGDGFDDFIIGVPKATTGPLYQAGQVLVISGATGMPLVRLAGGCALDLFGSSVANAGDVDGDGFPDQILGAPSLGPEGGAVVYSTAKQALLYGFHGLGTEQFGFAVDGAGDIDGDGFDDVIVGTQLPGASGFAIRGSVEIFSGATGAKLAHFEGKTPKGHFGYSVAGLGDIDGDGYPDLATGVILADPSGIKDAGAVKLLTHNPILTASTTTLSAAQGGVIDYSIDFPDTSANQTFGILLSLSGTGPTLLGDTVIPLTADTLFLASLLGNTPPETLSFQGTLDGNAQATAQIKSQPGALDPALIGTTINLAVVTTNLNTSSVATPIQVTP